MAHVVPAREALGVRTIFNFLGPLTNPAGAPNQVLGVFADEWVEPLAHVLAHDDPRVVRWLGDDAAIVRAGGFAAVSTDVMVDGTHFRLGPASPEDVGWRALAGALSDLAAVGAEAGGAPPIVVDGVDPPPKQGGDPRGGHQTADLAGFAGGLQEGALEELLGRVPPLQADRVPHVRRRPRQHHGVVRRDDERDGDLPPADPLDPAVHAPEHQRRGSAPAIAHGVLEGEQRHTGGQQCEEVGHEERPATIAVGDVRKPPDVAEPDRRADRRHEESVAGSPSLGCAGGHDHAPRALPRRDAAPGVPTLNQGVVARDG